MERLRTAILLKRNLKALLRRRGKKQGELARFLRRKGHDDDGADSWISHILDESDPKELGMEHWDRTAEFLGVDTFQFFIPGIANNESTERRSGVDRRQRSDRRIGTALPERNRDLDLMNVIRAIPDADLDEAIAALMKILDRALQRRRGKRASSAEPASTGGNSATAPAPKRARKKIDQS